MENFADYNPMNRIIQRIKARRGKWQFLLFFFLLLIIFLLGYVSPILVESTKNTWNEKRRFSAEEIKAASFDLISQKQNKLLNVANSIKQSLRAALSPEVKHDQIFELIMSEDFKSYSISLFAPPGELIAWNELVYFYEEELNNSFYETGSSFFYKSNLLTFLAVLDTINIADAEYKIFVGLPVKCSVEYLSEKFRIVNLDDEISQSLSAGIDIHYEPFKSKNSDQMQSSFEILNNHKEKIGLLAIDYPSLQSEIKKIRKRISAAQSLLILISFLILGYSLKQDYNSFNSRFIKFGLLLLYLSLGRALLFATNFPNNFLPAYLSDPNLFSSKFGEGIVRSPIDFFVTTLFFFVVALQAFNKSKNYFLEERQHQKRRNLLSQIIGMTALTAIFMLSIRAFAAICKSVIFDSTLRYFKEPEIFPPISHISMLGTLLICGAGFLLALIAISLTCIKFLSLKRLEKKNIFTLAPASALTIISTYYIQNEPLAPLYFYFLFITIIVLLFKFVASSSDAGALSFGIYLFAASFVSTIFINHFNNALERNSLISTALELERSNFSFYNFLMNESLESLKEDEQIAETFLNHDNEFHSAGFLSLQRLKLSGQSTAYAIYFLDRSRAIVGGFSHNVNSADYFISFFSGIKIDETIIKEAAHPNGGRYLTGITVIRDRNIILGYAALTIKIENRLFKNEKERTLFSDAIDKPADVISSGQLSITILNGRGIEQLHGSYIPSRHLINDVVNNSSESDNEYWFESENESGKFVTLAYRIAGETQPAFYIISLKKNDVTFALFNFFKIFIVHTIIILIVYLIIILLNLRKFLQIFLAFRTKLLASLLFISLIPIIALAVYNRVDSSAKIVETYKENLREKILLVERHIQNQLVKNPQRELEVALQKASEELETNFSVYRGTKLLFSSFNQYYLASLFPRALPPSVFIDLQINDGKQFFSVNESNQYYAYFKKSSINDSELIFAVDNIFNKVQTAFSPIEIDVFLVGVYSFAILIILVTSAFISNTISTPIRKLTRATQSVAMGDLNIELKSSDTGEIKELISGFNYMTNELKKSQMEISQLERENAWREMAKQIAHEIKNPLTPMKLTIQQLIAAYKDRSTKFDSIFEKVSNTILNQIETLNQIASEFSRFARMPNLSLEKINLEEILEEIKILFEDENMAITINAELESCIIDGDHSQTRRMFVNLCRNSIQAGARKINFSIYKENNFSCVDVSDNGCGINEEDRQNIFKQNFTSKASGMGLGLKLAKRYMESVEGSIELVQSEKGNTLFRIKFK